MNITIKGEKGTQMYTHNTCTLSHSKRVFDGYSLDNLKITFEFESMADFEQLLKEQRDLTNLLEQMKYCFWSPDLQNDIP
jgi:hypothetical protein